MELTGQVEMENKEKCLCVDAMLACTVGCAKSILLVHIIMTTIITAPDNTGKIDKENISEKLTNTQA
jgi:hypothetical protein